MTTTTIKAKHDHEVTRAINFLRETNMIEWVEPQPKYYNFYLLEDLEEREVISVIAEYKTGTINGIVTKPEYRRQGYATQLIHDYINMENKEKIEINGSYEHTEGFYESLNVEVEGL